MGEFFIYIVKSGVCLAAFYLFYKWLLSRETFHRFNRIVLLAIVLLSGILPLCRITTATPVPFQQSVIDIQQLLRNASSATPLPSIQFPTAMEILLGIYAAGAVFFFCRLLYSICQIGRMIRKGSKKKLDNGLTLVVYDAPIVPFSWWNYIVISAADNEEYGKEILLHEIAHAKNRHSWDVLFTELCIVFHWFNPAAWLLKQELQNLHEYEADAAVIYQGVDARQYQLLLIKKAAGNRFYSVTNSFNHSKLKKRITMMLKKQSNPWAKLKFCYLLPLAALTMAVYAQPEMTNLLPDDQPKIKGEVIAIRKDSTDSTQKTKIVPIGEKNRRKEVYQSKPLIFIDGKEAKDIRLNDLDPTTIEKISVLKDKEAKKKYGEEGKNGVILITLKKEKQ